VSAVDCGACQGGWPARAQHVADLGLSVAYLHEDEFFSGWTILVLKRHATEPYELAGDERARLIDEVTAVARALSTVFNAVKMNYALLGNQVPHIHWHVVPRLAGDPAPREPVWTVPHAPATLDDAERRAVIARIRAAL